MNGVVDFYREKGLYERYRNELEYFYVRILLLSSVRRIAKIGDKEMRNRFLDRTLSEIQEHFPDYKRNPYLKGWRGAYMKCASPLSVRIFAKLSGVTR